MKKSLLTAVALVLLTTTAHAAKETILARKGNWSTSYYPANDAGLSMCSLWTRWTTNGQPVAALYTKYVAGRLIFVQLFKAGWSMPDGTEAKVQWSFDDETYSATAITYTDKQGQKYLQFRIANGDEAKFLGQFAEANRATVTFPDGNEPDWNADMFGSRETAIAFKRCAIALENNKPTQPTGPQASQPTQPQPTTPKKDPSRASTKKDNGSI